MPGVMKIILIVAGIAALAASALIARPEYQSSKKNDAKIAKNEERKDVLLEEITDEVLKYKGFLASVETLPDSVRQAEGLHIQRTYETHRKRIRTMEEEEFNLNWDIKKYRKRKKASMRKIQRRALPLAVLGGVFLATGVVRRRKSR